MSAYTDYRFKFPTANLAEALGALTALRQAGILSSEAIPSNMLGEPRDASGAVVSTNAAWVGRPGIPASSFTDPFTKETVDVPARGDPSYYYIHIRANVPDAELPFDPAVYGLIPTDSTESAIVLGVWA